MKKLLMVLATVLLLIIAGCSSSSDPIPQPESSEKSITSYSLNGIAGIVNETERTITVAMPFGTDVTAMIATFITTGASVKIGATEQMSGTTANDFTNQVTYTVTAADATTQDYTVTVTVAQASSKEITSFSIAGVAGTINETNKTIAVTLPFGSLVTNKIATFITTGTSVKVGSTVQVSGTTANDFISPVTYTVVAADTTTQDYTVTVIAAQSSAKAITAFSLNGSVGTIDEVNKTIAVTMPYGTYVMDLVATFTITGVSVKVDSVIQVSGTTAHNFTSPVTYTVTAGDSTTQDYVATVTVAPSPAKAITAFSLNGVAGTIDESAKTIAVAMPLLTNANSLVATFTTTGASVKVDSTVQASGTTATNFTSPVTYIVTAADGTTADYIVTVTLGAWRHPASLSDNITPDGKDAKYAQVAMDKNGNAIIVWSQSDGANSQIFKSEYRNGVWHHPASLSDNISPDGQDAQYPQVAMDDNGNAIITWTQNYSTKSSGLIVDSSSSSLTVTGSTTLNGELTVSYPSRIFKSEYRNGIWTHPTSLSDGINPDGQYSLNPRVAMDNSGNVIIAWYQSDNMSSKIFRYEYRDGVWQQPVNIKQNSDSANGIFALAMDNNGNAIIAWVQFDEGTSYQIFKSERRNGVWTGPAGSSDHISPNGKSAHSPQVAMDDHGNAIIVWQQNYDPGKSSPGILTVDEGTTLHGTLIITTIPSRIFKSEYRNGIWTHPASLSDYISPGEQDASNPHVAMDNNSNALIVWSEAEQKTVKSSKSVSSTTITTGTFDLSSSDSNAKIFKSEYRGGVWHHPAGTTDTISPAVQNAYTGHFYASPQAAMDDNGNAVIVWHQFDGSNLRIFKSEYRGGVWHHPASLADSIGPNGQNAEMPKVAMSNNGTAMIGWHQSDGASSQIFKSEYR